MNATIVRCRCQHCNKNVEFDPDFNSPGSTIPCPHCSLDTLLYIPQAPAAPAKKSTPPPPAPAPAVEVIKNGLLACPECRSAISSMAISCPMCGRPHPFKPASFFKKRREVALRIVGAIIAIIGLGTAAMAFLDLILSYRSTDRLPIYIQMFSGMLLAGIGVLICAISQVCEDIRNAHLK